MSGDAQVIVVGLGAVGSAALLSLASRGVSCIGIDRFDPPHDRGSSHGLSRLIRLCYYEHPDYVPLLHESYRLWQELQSRSGSRLLDITGGLYIGRPQDPFVSGSLETARQRGLAHDMLIASELRRRFPSIHVFNDEVAFYEPTTGVLYPERCIAASLHLAEASGARVLRHTRVRAWSDSGTGVIVHAGEDRIRADAVILCAGAWTSALVPELSTSLTVTRQILAWFEPKNPELLKSAVLPSWAVSRHDGAAHYGFPLMKPDGGETPGGDGFKIALHATGHRIDPETHRSLADIAEVEELRRFLTLRFPEAFDDHPRLLSARACMYTNTPDHHFLIDQHPESSRVVVVSACSGHGFKMSSAIGTAAADLALHGATPMPITFLSWRKCLKGL